MDKPELITLTRRESYQIIATFEEHQHIETP